MSEMKTENSYVNTLADFDEYREEFQQEGYYAAWISGIAPLGAHLVHGFSGEIVKFTQQYGWHYDAEWFDEGRPEDINLKFLESIPSLEELM